ncbi:MAG: hypothetical protein KDD47_26675, partial [Acidobacteria bacterium]|nr:hypothetical protein [Acidobacteriota bacterium]
VAISRLFSFHAFNINHLSDAGSPKMEVLKAYLDGEKPDLLSLTEVNSMDGLRAVFGADPDYELVESREMVTGNSPYTFKDSAQFESYPILVRRGSGLEVRLLGSISNDPKGASSRLKSGKSAREKGAEKWINSRPLQVFAVTHPELGSVLMAPIHTSPSGVGDIGGQIDSYADGILSLRDTMLSQAPEVPYLPVLLLGDFYNASTDAGRSKIQGLTMRLDVQKPQALTNFHGDQDDSSKEPADYFVGSRDLIEAGSVRAVPPPGKELPSPPPASSSSAPALPNVARLWKEPVDISDHAPVAAQILLDNAWTDPAVFFKAAQEALGLLGGSPASWREAE